MISKKCLFSIIFSTTLVTGCATWSTSSIEGADKSAVGAVAFNKTPINQIFLTDQDVLAKKYIAVGDIKATVNKTTVFHPSPTREMVNEELRKQAHALGADAVILIRYGEVGVSFMSWGSLEGKGRAIKYAQ
ncbi:MAG: hypothetical protein ACOYB1_01705 [Limnohabitans sp.]